MQSIFNGRDLTDWEGNRRFWSVEEGCLTGRASQTNTLSGFRYIIWRGGVLEDFELRLSFRKTGEGGASGVDYRHLESSYRTYGYRCQVGPGWLVDDRPGKTVELAALGEKTVAKVINGENQKIILGRTAATNDILRVVSSAGWKDLVITAAGGHLVHQIDGMTMVDALDERPTGPRAGFLAFHIVDKATNTFSVEFKDIRLRRLPMSTNRVVYADSFEELDAEGRALYWHWTGPTNQGQSRTLRSEGQNHYAELAAAVESNQVNLYRGFQVDPTWKKLKFAVRVRLHDVAGDGTSRFGAEMGVEWMDSNRHAIGKTQWTPFVQKAAAWTSSEKTFEVPTTARSVLFRLALYHTRGRADFDDFQIRVMENREATPVAAGAPADSLGEPGATAAAEAQNGFVPVFNGKDLTGWKLREPRGRNSWSVMPGGVLKNTVEKGMPGNDLVTDKKYWNFIVRCEYMAPDDSHSGLYLRGRHEIQIVGDSKKGKTSLRGNGAIYDFKAPNQFVTKSGNEWQTVEAAIIGHSITVILNGVKIHDNVECIKATGAEIDRNVNEPGPIFLQGVSGTVSFRNIRIKELPDAK